jgi:hypothetical protein
VSADLEVRIFFHDDTLRVHRGVEGWHHAKFLVDYAEDRIWCACVLRGSEFVARFDADGWSGHLVPAANRATDHGKQWDPPRGRPVTL